jgi:Secreted repeat of unknown function
VVPLTDGAPIAGPGVNPALLGTVTRKDVLSGQPVQQVTYAGLPLYRFFLDETPGETEGANLFDPVTGAMSGAIRGASATLAATFALQCLGHLSLPPCGLKPGPASIRGSSGPS